MTGPLLRKFKSERESAGIISFLIVTHGVNCVVILMGLN